MPTSNKVYGNYVFARELVDPTKDEFLTLFQEHWAETEQYLMVKCAPDRNRALTLQGMGSVVVFTVRLQDTHTPVGYMVFSIGESIQVMGMRVAADQGVFLTKEHRKGLLALKLLRYAERALRGMGVHLVIVTSKWMSGGTKIEKLYKREGYMPTAVSFVKPLKD